MRIGIPKPLFSPPAPPRRLWRQLGVVARRVVACGYHVLGARFEIAPFAQGTDDALADRVEYRRDLRIGGWLLGAKPWLAALSTALFIDSLKEDQMVMQIEDTLSTTPCRPP
jgi:hypothetical protein